MTNPHTRIEMWHGANLLYQLDDEAINVHTKEILTDGVGTFSFTLPIAKGITRNLYSDVALYDTAKVWINYDAISGDPLTAGPICQTQGNVTDGYSRVFLCKNQGEVLTRRFKTKNYVNVDASTIIAELASDLSLGTSFTGDASDAFHENFFFDHESYFDCVRTASDFWVSAGVEVKKDFYVDVGDVGHPLGHLIWKTRPIRTAGVETLTFGKNIESYTVQRDLTAVKNYLWIYGKLGKIQYDSTSKLIDNGRKYPTDGDTWTEATTDWTAAIGTMSAPALDQVVGAKHIHCTSDISGGLDKVDFYHVNSELSAYGFEGYQTINFYLKFTDSVANATLKVYAPDSSNYFVLSLASITSYARLSYLLGEGNEYNAITNPSGQWTKVGTPDWHDIHGVRFYAIKVSEFGACIDGLYFGHGRWRSIVQDAVVSQPAYGIREMTHVDDKLESDSQCEQRGESLLYQVEAAPTRLDVTTSGNINILIGDRLTMTIPPENISAAAYDAITVEHFVNLPTGFKTKASMVNSSDCRVLPTITPNEAMIQQYKQVRDINRAIQNRK